MALDVNTRISVEMNRWRRELSSRVEDRTGDGLVIGAPMTSVHALAPGTAGDLGVIRWIERGQGQFETPVELVDVRRDPIDLWWLRVTGPTAKLQRRRFVRVDTSLPMHVGRDGETVDATLADISEGGMRAVASPRVGTVGEGDLLEVDVVIGDTSFELQCVVVRVEKLTDGRQRLAATWEGMPERDADLLRRFVFRRQQQQLRREVEDQ
jgi:c-di-GMP-binding flagellar brake protein YcgR